MKNKRAETAAEVLEKYKKAEMISPDWERVTIFSWNDMLLLKAEIAKLKNERDLWIDRAEQLWSMYERDAPTPDNSVTWFDDMGAAKREATK